MTNLKVSYVLRKSKVFPVKCLHRPKNNASPQPLPSFQEGAEAETETAGTPTSKGTSPSTQEASQSTRRFFFYKYLKSIHKMDAQELRNLQEAYMEVVENQQLDEDSRRMSNKQKTASVRQNIKAFGSNFTPPNNYDPDANRGQGEVLTRKQIEKKRRKSLRQEEVSVYDIILSHLLDEGYAETPEAAEAIMVNMSEEWRESIVEEVISEGEKPFPHEKVERKQKALRSQGGNALDRRMKMGLARRRAKEAEKTGGSQKDAGKGWYHGK